MGPDDLFNFERLLGDLTAHDWDGSPVCALIGPERCGKSKVAEEFAVRLSGERLVLAFDAHHARADDTIVVQALSARMVDGEFSRLKARITSPGAQVILSNVVADHSKIKIDLGRKRRFLGRKRREPATQAQGGLTSLVLDEIDRVRRPTWVIIDHADNSSTEMMTFLRAIAGRVRDGSDLKLLLVVRGGRGSDDLISVRQLVGRVPADFRVRNLEADEVSDWAAQLGIVLGPGHAALISSLTSNGMSGKVWEALMQLYVDEQWTSSSQSAM